MGRGVVNTGAGSAGFVGCELTGVGRVRPPTVMRGFVGAVRFPTAMRGLLGVEVMGVGCVRARGVVDGRGDLGTMLRGCAGFVGVDVGRMAATPSGVELAEGRAEAELPPEPARGAGRFRCAMGRLPFARDDAEFFFPGADEL